MNDNSKFALAVVIMILFFFIYLDYNNGMLEIVNHTDVETINGDPNW